MIGVLPKIAKETFLNIKIFFNLGAMFSEELKRYTGSTIRELLKYAHQEGVISLAGGMPNPEIFPKKEEITDVIKSLNLEKALQYGLTSGVEELKEEIAKYVKKKGIDVMPENIVITSGSQQGLKIISRIFLNEMDTVVVEKPMYLGERDPLRGKDASVIEIELESDGMNLDLLEERLKEIERRSKIKGFYWSSRKIGLPKYIYVVPTFQNPSGITMSEKKRKRLVDIANEYNIYIIEDDPYSDLRYDGEQVKSLRSFGENVIYLGTFSKIFVPGFRVGWLIGNEKVVESVIKCKQSEDLHTSTFSQYLIAEYMRRGLLEERIKNVIIPFYKEKRDIILKAIDDYLDASYVKPEGGLFVWIKVNKDTSKMLKKAIKEGVAYVPGKEFTYHRDDLKDYMRLNFSLPKNEELVEGIKRLSKVINS